MIQLSPQAVVVGVPRVVTDHDASAAIDEACRVDRVVDVWVELGRPIKMLTALSHIADRSGKTARQFLLYVEVPVEGPGRQQMVRDGLGCVAWQGRLVQIGEIC